MEKPVGMMVLGSVVLGCLVVLTTYSQEVDAASPVTKIRVTTRTATDPSGVGIVSCRSNEKVTGGGCDCSGSPANNEAGVLFACTPVGNSYVGCYDFGVSQTRTPIAVRARCMSTTPRSGVASTAPAQSLKLDPTSDKSEEALDREKVYREMQEAFRNIR